MVETHPDEWKTWAGVAQVRQRCEKQASDEGLMGLELFFRSQRLFQEALEKKPTYREMQAAWRARQPKAAKVNDPMRAALEAIRDGHNDPRNLAASVLNQIESKEQSE